MISEVGGFPMNPTANTHQLDLESQRIFKAGSKSFSFAASLFDQRLRRSASLLYHWCRHCDDEIDRQQTVEAGLVRLQVLTEQSSHSVALHQVNEGCFAAFQTVTRESGIPDRLPQDFLEGMRWDIESKTYESLPELLEYCYRVAGTVGQMMCHVMGVTSQEALSHASDLGKAMQLTNIARDVFEDASLGRVYLPQAWLREAGINQDGICDDKNRQALVALVNRLLREAWSFYRSGERGTSMLPYRAACAVAAASSIYEAIGNELQKRGATAWDERVVISKGMKIIFALLAVTRITWRRLVWR